MGCEGPRVGMGPGPRENITAGPARAGGLLLEPTAPAQTSHHQARLTPPVHSLSRQDPSTEAPDWHMGQAAGAAAGAHCGGELRLSAAVPELGVQRAESAGSLAGQLEKGTLCLTPHLGTLANHNTPRDRTAGLTPV